MNLNEAVERGQVQGKIIRLFKSLDKEIDDLINSHYLKFHNRKATDEEHQDMLWVVKQFLSDK